MALAPIVVFSYNRPNHLRRVLDTLSRNDLAQDSDLFIFCDGAKPNASEQQKNQIIENRNIARGTEGFGSLHIVERESNYGLARNIIEGISLVISKYDRVIVLEDDLLTSPYFLKYMNSALDFYEHFPGVMSVSANRPPMNKMEIPGDYEYDVFASLRSYSTGWGTWKDRWDRVDWSLDYLEEFLKHPKQVEAFNRCGDDMTDMLIDQRDGRIDSWAIRFSFAHFREHSVAILPCIPYVDNIGFDGTGRHSGVNTIGDYRNDLSLSVANPRFLDVIYEDSRIINSFYNYYCRKKRSIWKKCLNFLARKFRRRIPFPLKKKVYE